MGSITNTIKRERKKERDHKPYYIVTEREKKKERKRETDVENIVVSRRRNRHGQSNTDKVKLPIYNAEKERKKERKAEIYKNYISFVVWEDIKRQRQRRRVCPHDLSKEKINQFTLHHLSSSFKT